VAHYQIDFAPEALLLAYSTTLTRKHTTARKLYNFGQTRVLRNDTNETKVQ
jgi:hypothetical protein